MPHCFILLFTSAGVLVCKTVPFVQTTAIVTGILTMTCIAIERYQGIVFPLKMRRQYSSKRAYKMLGILCLQEWLIPSRMWMCFCDWSNLCSEETFSHFTEILCKHFWPLLIPITPNHHTMFLSPAQNKDTLLRWLIIHHAFANCIYTSLCILQDLYGLPQWLWDHQCCLCNS